MPGKCPPKPAVDPVYPRFDAKAFMRRAEEFIGPCNSRRRNRVWKDLPVHKVFKNLLSSLEEIAQSNPDDCSFRVIIAVVLKQFLEYGDLNDPKKVYDFLQFVHDAFVDYAPRYIVDGVVYRDANLGELGPLLAKLREAIDGDNFNIEVARNLVPTIIMITAYATWGCLLRENRGPEDSVNGIDGFGHTMELQDAHFRNSLMMSVRGEVTEGSSVEVRSDKVLRTDLHTQHGTPTYKEFETHSNEDRQLVVFFDKFKTSFAMPEGGFKFGDRKIVTVEPSLLNLLLGILLLALESSFIRAVHGPGANVTAMIASERNRAVFEEPTGDENKFSPMRLGGWLDLWLCFGLHPTSIMYLNTKPFFWKIPSLDKSYSRITIALAEREVEVEVKSDDGVTTGVRIPDGPIRVHRATAAKYQRQKTPATLSEETKALVLEVDEMESLLKEHKRECETRKAELDSEMSAARAQRRRLGTGKDAASVNKRRREAKAANRQAFDLLGFAINN